MVHKYIFHYTEAIYRRETCDNMLATQHLASTRGAGRSAFADVPRLPTVARPRRLAVNNSASVAAPLAPIREEQTFQSHKGIDKIKAITSGVGLPVCVLVQSSLLSPLPLWSTHVTLDNGPGSPQQML